MSPTAACPVCRAPSTPHDSSLVLEKHLAEYRLCTECGAVFVVEPVWLEEAYREPIKDEDSGLLLRCEDMRKRTSMILAGEGIKGGRFLDWAGGYGTFTRMMRDRGYDYYHHDPFCDNLFARGFEDRPDTDYDLISAFEVFEHLRNPYDELLAVTQRTDRLLVSTAILPDPAPAAKDWWYFGPEHGQHITFYTERSLRRLGEQLGFDLTTNGVNLHLFHRRPLKLRTQVMFSTAARRARRQVLNALRPARGRYAGGR